MATVTMGDLCLQDHEEDKQLFDAIIKIIDNHFPTNWRSWSVNNFNCEELFGGNLTPKIEAKLRFALPTGDLSNIIAPGEGKISERKYRSLKRKLIQWPIGRAVLYSPHSIMERIHTQSYDVFMEAVKNIKSKITAIRPPPSPAISDEHHTPTQKRPSSEIMTTPSPKTVRVEDRDTGKCLEKILGLLSSQNQAIEAMSQRLATVEKNIEAEEDQDQHNQSLESVPDSTGSENDWQAPSLDLPNLNNVVTDEESILTSQIAEAQRRLAILKSAHPQTINSEISAHNDKCIPQPTTSAYTDLTEYDFFPSTTESEPKILKTDPIIAKQGRKCQRLGEEGWKNIRYGDVQKTFHATPVFCALKVNPQLATATPAWQTLTLLEKIDLTLAGISHGLLQQRKAFQESCSKLDPQSQKIVQKEFLAPDSTFRKTSDSLLQYTCGRRAEVIQHRREVYKVPNKVLNDIIHEVPPSDTHLFSEEKLSEVLKENGGIHKFFPGVKKYTTNTRPQQNQIGKKQSTKVKPGHTTWRPNHNKKPQASIRNFQNRGKEGFRQNNANKSKAFQGTHKTF